MGQLKDSKRTNDLPDENRRGFIRGSSLILASALPNPSRQDLVSRPIKVGLVGCGRSGIQLATAALAHPTANVCIAGLADVRPAKIQQAVRNLKSRFPKSFAVSGQERFSGFDCGSQLLAQDLDLAIIATPYGLRPEHAKTAVSLQKHVYTEQPVAVDAASLAWWENILKAAKAGDTQIAVGNRISSAAKYSGAIDRVKRGAIGKITRIECEYVCSNGWPKDVRKRDADELVEMNEAQRFANWQRFRALSGDGTLRYRCELAHVLRALTGASPSQAEVVSHVEYGQAELDSRVRFAFCSKELDNGASTSDGFEVISRVHIQSAPMSPAERIQVVGKNGLCDLVRGRFFDLENRLVDKVEPQKVRRESHLQELISQIAEQRSSDHSNVDGFCDDILSATMAMAACETGRTQVRTEFREKGFRFPTDRVCG